VISETIRSTDTSLAERHPTLTLKMNPRARKELRDKVDEIEVANDVDVDHNVLARRVRTSQWRDAWITWIVMPAAASLIGALYGGYQWSTAPEPCDRDCRAAHLLLASHIVPVVRGMPPYVPRPLVEATLATAIGHLGQSYVVMIGPRGAGKTRVVEAAVANRTGVVRLDLGQRLQTRDDVYRAIFAELSFKLAGEFPYFGISVVTRVFQRVASLHLQRHPDAVDWVPTVIVELRTGGEDDDRSVTNAVATALKPLAAHAVSSWC
jgi:hypothetical protein